MSFNHCLILLSGINILSAAFNNTSTTAEPTPNTTVEELPNSEYQILWSRLPNYTCKNLISAINIFYNISQNECELRCLSFPNNSRQCTAAVWYEYIKPTGTDVPRCYLFGQSCELVIDTTKPVTASFWYYDASSMLRCVDYPSNWKDNYFDDCDAYSMFHFCDYAYNSSTTAILSYQDTIYGFDALKVCCGCNGGLLNYANTFLFEPKWKPTSILNIYEDYNDFICEAVDIAATTNILIEDNGQGIPEKDKFNFTQFVDICQRLHASLLDKYKLLLSINTQDNDIIKANNIYTDFHKFKQFDCVNSLLLNNVTICQTTDYNNLYPFIIDLEQDHIYINDHYIHSDTFLYHLPQTHVSIQSFCSFEMFLNTTFPTKPPTKEPTFEPTFEPTIIPTNEPTFQPTQPTVDPTQIPTNHPTFEPTFEPSTNPTNEPTNEPTQVPTRQPSEDPTYEPTNEPTKNPTNEPTLEPTIVPTKLPSEDPTYEPTNEPTNDPSTEPTTEPTIIPTELPSQTPSKNPTAFPSRSPTSEPTTEPTIIPTEFPSESPSKNPSAFPSKTPTFEPTMEPTQTRRRLLNHIYSTPYFKTNVIAAFLCSTRYTTAPTFEPTKFPTVEPTEFIQSSETFDSTLSEGNAEMSDTLSGGVIAGIVIGAIAFVAILFALIYLFVHKKQSEAHNNAVGSVPATIPAETPADTHEHKTGGLEMQMMDFKVMSASDNLSVPRPSAPVSENESENESKHESELDESWQNKRMKNWSNEEILDWMKCMNLGAEWNNKILTVIEMNECTGEDIIGLKTAEDVGESFEITNNNVLCKRILKEIKNFKPKGSENNMFNIRLFENGKNGGLTLEEEVTKTDTIGKVKTLYKIQEGIDCELAHIHFKYKKKKLLDSKRLEQCGIKNGNHLIEVDLDNVFKIRMNAQGKDLTLQQKVTKEYTISQIKQMYKLQSGVYSTVEEIQFYKGGNVLESRKTLAQCGITDDKHLINVMCEAGGGGEGVFTD